MFKKIMLTLLVLVLLLPVVFSGCTTTGITQETYDRVVAQLNEIQAKLSEAQNNLTKALSDKDAINAELQKANDTISSLQKQVGGLQEQTTLAGATPAETAAKIVKNYHETHVYSLTDLFICSDMSAEVWNMLKAQNIKAIIVVGNKDTAITDILQSNHAWVIADVGGKLALETTAGITVTAAKNPLYYRGWYFDSPTDLKSYNDYVKEYNLRVGFRNMLKDEVVAAQTKYNDSSTQAEADKYLALYNKLKELKDAQEAELNKIMDRINGLAKTL
jgi:predicted  nucleic acid-binding Zn-ribbon protein